MGNIIGKFGTNYDGGYSDKITAQVPEYTQKKFMINGTLFEVSGETQLLSEAGVYFSEDKDKSQVYICVKNHTFNVSYTTGLPENANESTADFKKAFISNNNAICANPGYNPITYLRDTVKVEITTENEAIIMRSYNENGTKDIIKLEKIKKEAVSPEKSDKKVSSAGSSEPISSDKLRNTEITPCITTPLSRNKNIIFCPTFQLAWDTLCDLIGEPLKLSENPKIAEELNESIGSTTKRDISKDSYVAKAGKKVDRTLPEGGIIAHINKKLKEKFGPDVPLLNENMLGRPDDILAYAYLLKDLKFKNNFNNLEKPISFDNGKTKTPVEAFGIGKFDSGVAKQREVMDQAKILYYGNGGSIVQLETTSPDDELILAKIKQGETLEETYNNMNKLIAEGKGEQWKNGDSLQIPKIDLNISHNYKELEGKNVNNTGFTGYYIAKAQQDVKFSLNEEGARLESQAKIVMSRGMSINKNIVFDQPFLVCLRQKGSKRPYLLIWVNDPEILKQIQK